MPSTHGDTTSYSVVETAKLLRAALKQTYPGIKFGVKSTSYSGGASINVTWTDGPVDSDVEKTAKQFEGATFDGRTDSMNYLTKQFAGAKVRWGANFVFVRRAMSADHIAAVTDTLPVEPDGKDNGQCQACGDWKPTDDRWMAKIALWDGRPSTVFACTRECAGRKTAAHVPA